MKNKVLIVIATVLGTVFIWILFLNLFESDNINHHYFIRKYSNNSVLKLDKIINKVSNFKYIDNISSNDSIIELEKKILDDNKIEYKLYFNDFEFKNRVVKKVVMPEGCNLLYYHKNKVYFTKSFKLYSCDVKTNKILNYPLKNLKLSTIKFLNTSNDELILFGELIQENKFISGFFKLSLNDYIITPLKIVETNLKSQFLANTLKYVGEFTFSQSDSVCSFACDKYSKIYFFDKNGNYIKELTTKDNAPIPIILTNENGDSFYSRGSTWNTNTAAFVKNGYVYVFSAREKSYLSLIIDKYSLKNLNYLESYKIKCNNFGSRDITNLFINENGIVVSFSYNYASLKFSRYTDDYFFTNP